MQKGNYLFSIDGGGTKTEFCLYDISDGTMESFIFGSTNYKNVGLKAATSNLKDSFYKICNSKNIEPEEIRGIIIGVSGCDTKRDYEVYESIVSHMRLDQEKVYICNDSELVFLSVAEIPGICVIAGTGSIAIGLDRKGNSYRCGGWGSPLSDQGSGYWIGEQILKKWIKYCDGQIAYDPIFKNLNEFYHLEKIQEIPYFIADLNHTDIASCAHLISNAAENGNQLCEHVIKAAAYETADMAAAVYKKLSVREDEKIDMVTSGSIFNSCLYLKTFKEQFYMSTGNAKVEYVTFHQSPAQAGIRLAKNKFYNKQ